MNQAESTKERTKMRSTLATVIFVFSVIAVSVTGAFSGTTPNSDSNRALLLVVNKGDRTLSIVDPESGSQLAAVPVGGTTGHEVAVSPDGRTLGCPSTETLALAALEAMEERSVSLI